MRQAESGPDRRVGGRWSAPAWALGSLAVVMITVSRPAGALEGNSAFLRGITIGVPIAVLPPPGAYLSSFATQYVFPFFDAGGAKTGSHINETIAGSQLLYIPDLPSIFGATYGAAFGQPIEYNRLQMPGAPGRDQFGAANTIIEPVVLSWTLPGHFHFSSDLTVYPPDGTYNVHNPASVSRHYATIEPGVGLTYMDERWLASLHPVLDVNWTNPADHYRSGAVLVMDYSGLVKFDRLSAGLGGTLTYQVNDDTVDGAPVAAILGQRGRGNRARDVTIGPVLSYKVADATVRAYATQSIFTRNTAAGASYYVTLSVPLTQSKSSAQNSGDGPR